MQVKDRFEFAYPEINLDKPLKPADQAIVKRFVNKEMSKKSYADHIVGDVYRGYMPRMGQFDIEANIPKIQKFMAERINRKVEEVSKYEEISIKEEKKCIIISPRFVELDDAGNIKTLRDKIRNSGITIKI